MTKQEHIDIQKFLFVLTCILFILGICVRIEIGQYLLMSALTSGIFLAIINGLEEEPPPPKKKK